jgi:cytochrome c oxidase subunit II
MSHFLSGFPLTLSMHVATSAIAAPYAWQRAKAILLPAFVCLLLFQPAKAGTLPKAHQDSDSHGDIASGRAYFTMCTGCHGTNASGNSDMKGPNLTGLSQNYIREQLENFRSGSRGVPIDYDGSLMRARVLALPNEAALQDVAAYIVKLPMVRPPGLESGDAARGRRLYVSCATCHGPQASGDSKQQAPRLNNQPAWYVVRQLSNFRAGTRGAQNEDILGSRMRPFAQALPDDAALADVAAYIATKK